MLSIAAVIAVIVFGLCVGAFVVNADRAAQSGEI